MVYVGFVRRTKLIQARKAAGKSQEQVAKDLEVHRTQVSQWESGTATPHPRQRGAYAEAISLSLSELHSYLSSLPAAENETPIALKIALAVEQAATEARSHVLNVVNGLLQTPDYAGAIARAVGTNTTSEEYVQQNIDQRAQRQQRVHNGDVRLYVVQPEASLRSRLGNNQIMATQMRHLAEMATRPNVTIQVVPFDIGQYEAQRIGTFTLNVLPFGSGAPTVDLHAYGGTQLIDDTDEATYFQDAFDHACRLALSPTASIEFIEELSKEWETRT
jgi:transcriptional regulator with XRE-family HTH domain